jgi:2-keto-4-pentenoate hydratase
MNEELKQAQQRQLERLAALEAAGESVGGWKLGQTSGESRDAFGPGVRPFGFILASRILDDDATLSWAEVGNGGIENEVCFVIASDITEPVNAQSVRDHLAGVAPAFEINQRRIPKTSPDAERIEDGLANWGIVVGPVREIRDNWQADDMTVTLCRDGQPIDAVPAAGHIDDHFETLARLANQLLEHGRHLQAGNRAITGAFGKQNQPEPGRWTGEFGEALGTVALRISA